MDYLDAILMNPISGLEDIASTEFPLRCPDTFRPHPFNCYEISMGMWDSYGEEECANLSGTRIDLWLSESARILELKAKFKSLLSQNFELNREHNASIHSQIYDIIDIAIVTSIIKRKISSEFFYKMRKMMDEFKIYDHRTYCNSRMVFARVELYYSFYKMKLSVEIPCQISPGACAKLFYLKVKGATHPNMYFFDGELKAYEEIAKLHLRNEEEGVLWSICQ